MNKFRFFIASILMLIPAMIFAQMKVSGTVTDGTTNESLPGVNIKIVGTTQGTTSDFDGKFQLENVKSGSVLEFSYIGYETQKITVTSSNIDVVMKEDSQSLEEVVIIGYGSTTKKDATGSVGAINSKDFNKGSIVTPASLISGKVAGVTITTDGAEGGGSAIRIRGGSSLGASNDPLIVVDGIPISNSNVGGSRSILSSINPNDIESFTVLKDASSTAIYGSRASNGVIMITTKKGKSTFKADLDYQLGYQTLANTIDVFSADEFKALVEDRISQGLLPGNLAPLGNANTNWQKEIYQEALVNNANFGMSGALFNKIPARLSLGMVSQPGLRKTGHFERGSTTLSLNPSLLKDHLKINLKANLSFEKNRFAEGVEGDALRFDPTQSVYDENSPYGGYFEYYDSAFNPLNAPKNPVASLMQYNDKSSVQRFLGSVEFDYKFHFLPDLKGVLSLGYDKSDGHGTKTRPTTSIRGYRAGVNQPFLGTYEKYNGDKINKLLDGYFLYTKQFDNLNFDLTAGYSYQQFNGESYSTGNQFDPTSQSDVKTDAEVRLIGFFGRSNLSFFDKYLLTLSYRRDGTSRFSPDNRWGNFPAAAFAWKLNESFFKDSNTISDLKLRLGWGITGQQDIDAAYAYLGRYLTGDAASQYMFGNQPIMIGVPQAIFEDVKWEETTTYNVGLDYGLFNNRLSGAVEVYLKESKDLLANVAIADGSNFSNAGWQNIGKFTSKGIEFSIGADVVKSDKMNWTLDYNINFVNTKINELFMGSDILLGDAGAGTGSKMQIHREGFAPSSFYVYKQLYDVDGNPVEGAYADLNQDGEINIDDRYIYKKPSADITMGLQSSFNYGKFDFSFNLRASLGNYVYNAVNGTKAQYNLLQATAAYGNIPTSVLDTNFNETADVYPSDYFVENASFLKLDNVNIGYNFENLKVNLESIRLYAGIQNVYTLTKYSGLDPEIFDGMDKTIYPRPRTFLMGTNIKFN